MLINIQADILNKLIVKITLIIVFIVKTSWFGKLYSMQKLCDV
jgi:hypothetical protein